MTDPDAFETRLAGALESRVAAEAAAPGVSATARARAVRRRRTRVSVVGAVASVILVASGVAVLRDGRTVVAPTDPSPPSTAPASVGCVDGTATGAGSGAATRVVAPATLSDLAAVAGDGVPGALCRYTNPATGDPVRDSVSTLTDQVSLGAADTQRFAELVRAAPPAEQPCMMIDSPPPVVLTVVLDVGAGLRTVRVPATECLGVDVAVGPDAPRAPVRDSGAVLSLLLALIESGDPAPSPGVPVDAPESCVPSDEVDRASLDGRVAWVRFCPGREGHTAPAEVPSDALVTHLDQLSELRVSARTGSNDGCAATSGRTYRFQVGYADGRTAEVSGRTDPDCQGRLTGGPDMAVDGPGGLGVYGLVMAAYGQQYADGFKDAPQTDALVCPADPQDPDSVDRDGDSVGLDTGFELGVRQRMVMPLAAVRGIVCTWSIDAAEPIVRALTVGEAERVRIGLHAIDVGSVDCGGSPDPTYTAVVEDRTGTRRAVTIVDSECSTIIRSDGGNGLGFAWLDR